MKTSEFIKKVGGLGYDCAYLGCGEDIMVKEDGVPFLMVKVKKVNVLDCNFEADTIPTDLFNLAIEYAKTPTKKREEEKQYYLKSIAPYTRRSGRSGKGYLNHITFTDEFRWISKLHTEFVKTRYTTKEWENVTGYSWDEIKTWATPIEHKKMTKIRKGKTTSGN